MGLWRFNGLQIYESQILKGSNIAWKARGKVMVSPAIFSLIKDADVKQLELIVKNLKVIDLDEYAGMDEFANENLICI